MTSTTVARRIIRCAAAFVPAGQRDHWRHGWNLALDRATPGGRRQVALALRAFGNACRHRQRHIVDADYLHELRQGWRQLRRHAAFAATAIGILTLGVAATVTIFSMTDQVLLRPLPYPASDRIVTVWETRDESAELLEAAPGNFLDWRERATSFDYLAAADPWSLNFAGGSRPEVFDSTRVTPGFFESFGVNPILGRLFVANDHERGHDQVLVLGERFWRDRFGIDPGIIGRTLPFEDGPRVVVGIAPADFEPRLLASPNGRRDVWAPKVVDPWEARVRGSRFWAVVGRLKEDVALETARAEMASIAQQLALAYHYFVRFSGPELTDCPCTRARNSVRCARDDRPRACALATPGPVPRRLQCVLQPATAARSGEPVSRRPAQ